MANDVSTMIQLEEDYPSKYEEKKLPLLDLKVDVKAMEREGMPKSCKLYYYYYRKPMANWLLMPENSALVMAVKRTSLTQYGLRILRNTKLEVLWSEKAEMLSEFAARLRDLGYNEKFQQQMI